MTELIPPASGTPQVGIFDRYQPLIEAEQALVPDITIDDTIRVKVLDKCGMTCKFCHNEGTPVASTIGFQALRVSIYAENNGIPFSQADITTEDAETFGKTLDDLRDAGLGRELHWTGGEPTLSKSLPHLTEIARNAQYSVKMTSNGQSGSRGLKELTEAGLQGVNFSVFGTTPEELAATQAPVFRDNIRMAANRLDKMNEAMQAACDLGLKVKANIVITGTQDIERGLRLLSSVPGAVKVRFQADTSNRQESLAAIYELMQGLSAQPTSRELVAGCSIDNYDYQLPDGRIVTFKQARVTRLPKGCDDCAIDKAGDCHEGYYGLRLYKDADNTYWISACIQRMDISEPVQGFLAETGLAKNVQLYRQEDYNELATAHSIKAI